MSVFRKVLSIYDKMSVLSGVICIYNNISAFSGVLCIYDNMSALSGVICIYNNMSAFSGILRIYDNMSALSGVICIYDNMSAFNGVTCLCIYDNMSAFCGVLCIYDNMSAFCGVLCIYDNMSAFSGDICIYNISALSGAVFCRGLPGAGGCHSVDGLLLLHHAGDLPDSVQERLYLWGHGQQVLWTLCGHCWCHQPEGWNWWDSLLCLFNKRIISRSQESLRWPIAMSWSPLSVNMFFSRTTGLI